MMKPLLQDKKFIGGPAIPLLLKIHSTVTDLARLRG
jgi:hypothetical protein